MKSGKQPFVLLKITLSIKVFGIVTPWLPMLRRNISPPSSVLKCHQDGGGGNGNFHEQRFIVSKSVSIQNQCTFFPGQSTDIQLFNKVPFGAHCHCNLRTQFTSAHNRQQHRESLVNARYSHDSNSSAHRLAFPGYDLKNHSRSM